MTMATVRRTFSQVTLLCCVAGFSRCSAMNFVGIGQAREKDARDSLDKELSGSASSLTKIKKLEEALRTTYQCLPKNTAGNIGHKAVRYVLHRMFVQRHGWYVRGLEPNNDTWHNMTEQGNVTVVKEWVPSFLQALLEERIGEAGTDLHNLAALAAALEDLVSREAAQRLQEAFRLHELPLEGVVDEEAAQDAVITFYITYLLQGNFSAKTEEEAKRKREVFAKKYTGWAEAETWLRDRSARYFAKDVDFNAMKSLVSEVGEQYYTLNDKECSSLKTTLLELEAGRPGRVRLSVFYKKGLYSHWRFNEKTEYLRSLGALDESDPEHPSVIVPNYAMARTNCLEASSLYAICCRDECEDLMSHLEREIGAQAASPDRIATLIAALPSNGVKAPRELPASLISRLHQVADSHGGEVKLYSRLFAQWMHHAYPRDCPYPHEEGIVIPQTPDEWMQDRGENDSQASHEEMLVHLSHDPCDGEVVREGQPCGEQDGELPWSEKEELLQHADEL